MGGEQGMQPGSVVHGRSDRAAAAGSQCRSDRGARWSCVERVWSDVCEMRLSLVLLWLGAAAACGPSRGYTRRQGARRISPLVFGQHDPNIGENRNTASGPPEGRITRDDERFKDLVPNYNPDIDFRDDEGTGADRLMTQRCKEKLNTLAISVMNQWPGVRLRVIEGWDEENSHLENSLHYEGRAVDLTTSDRDHSKYGMLARLAVEAGFDWVYYESRSYIHCSVKTESSVGTGAGCFPEGAMVYTEKGPRDITTIRIGDKVLSASDDGKMIYSEVLTFIDRDPNATRQFIEVTAENGVTITTTPSHLLLLAAADGWRESFAANVEIGDVLLTRGPADVMRPSRVVKTRMLSKRGVYAPLTRTGTIIVDDALASCYALVRSHSLAHAAMAPLRWMARWSGSSELPRGVHWYASALYSFGDFVLPTSYRYR
ncbi:desert hedgehog protein B [Spodoptera frugiperda]|uniref:Hedgehog protein n=2 Tax=Spodoptera frugiperda TaxID=7108 RepID=A0A9R0ET61_SPOFR|nr:desert hedgehog protein B [Spodoptera frugiperda]